MSYNPHIHHRGSIRLNGYDFSQSGLYFITICCQDRTCLFGEIVGTPLVVVQNGTGIQNDWNGDIDDKGGHKGKHQQKPQRDNQIETFQNKTIGDMMDAFKSITTVEYIRGVKTSGRKPFNGKQRQRNYYEHIILNEKSCRTISKYIFANPSKWASDKFYK